MRELVGSVTHASDDDRYRWLNDRLCAITGEDHGEDPRAWRDRIPKAGGE